MSYEFEIAWSGKIKEYRLPKKERERILKYLNERKKLIEEYQNYNPVINIKKALEV